MTERDAAIAQTVQLSNQIGNRKTNRRHKEELYQDLIDLVLQWDLRRSEIEGYAKEEHKRHHERMG